MNTNIKIVKGAVWGLMGALVIVCLPGIAAASETKAEVITLFNGKDFSEWEGLHANHAWVTAGSVSVSETNKKLFDVKPGQGIMVNGTGGKPTSNLLSKYQHGDCHLHIEFCVPLGSNSGVYFQGLYEIQVFDSWGKEEVGFSDCGGIYARYKDGKTYDGYPPAINASKAPGEWQTFDAVFRAPRFDADGKLIEHAKFLIIVHNGTLVHENVILTGPTRAHMPNKEEAPLGPLMLQGDHGPVAYRNIKMIPLQLGD